MTPPLHPLPADCCQSPDLRAAIKAGRVEVAIQLAWECHGTALIRLFLWEGFSHPDAEDMLMSVMALALERWSRFDGTNLCGWLNTLAKYEILTRRKQVSRQRIRFEANPRHPGAVDPVDVREVELLLAIVEEVGGEQVGANRAIFALAFEEGLSAPEIERRLAGTEHALPSQAIRPRLAWLRDQVAERWLQASLPNVQ